LGFDPPPPSFPPSLIVGLDYPDPSLNLYQEFQRFKAHPAVRRVLEGGSPRAYGARTLNEGGWQSLPALSFPGGALLGCGAGTLVVPRLKGTHTAVKSGALAADAAFDALAAARAAGREAGPLDLSRYDTALRESWVGDELQRARNVRPG
jgi:electron-transferring-flavoprotein dehydrogenase